MGILTDKTTAFLEKQKQEEPLTELTREEREKWFEKYLNVGEQHNHIYEVNEVQIPTRDGAIISGKIIHPNSETKRPLILFFAGSLFLTSNSSHLEKQLKELAVESNSTVLAVQYRMDKFPTPVNDCIDAVEWATENAGSFRSLGEDLVLCGDGFGASIIAAAEQQLQHTDISIKALCLFYPALDPFRKTESKKLYSEGYLLTTEWLEKFYHTMLGDEEISAISAPLHGMDFSNHCPTYILKAEFDPLHDEAGIYAEKLAAAGVKVLKTEEPNTIHGFFSLPGIHEKATKQIIVNVDRFLKSL